MKNLASRPRKSKRRGRKDKTLERYSIIHSTQWDFLAPFCRCFCCCSSFSPIFSHFLPLPPLFFLLLVILPFHFLSCTSTSSISSFSLLTYLYALFPSHPSLTVSSVSLSLPTIDKWTQTDRQTDTQRNGHRRERRGEKRKCMRVRACMRLCVRVKEKRVERKMRWRRRTQERKYIREEQRSCRILKMRVY